MLKRTKILMMMIGVCALYAEASDATTGGGYQKCRAQLCKEDRDNVTLTNEPCEMDLHSQAECQMAHEYHGCGL